MALLDRNRSLWWEAEPAATYPALEGERRADVVVVGAGITGLTVAALLARRGMSVVVLEAHRVASGATGSTTAKVTSLHGLTYARLVEAKGEERARLYGQANQAAITQVAGLVETHGIDCAFTRAPAYTYVLDPARRDTVRREAEAAERLGLPASYTEETDLPYAVAGAVRFDDQAHFHPVRYAAGLAAAVTAAGGAVFEHSRALGLDDGAGGVVVRTAAGRVHADSAVMATLLPFLDVGGYFAKAHPTRSYALSVRSRQPVPTGMYLSADSPTRSVRPVQVDGAHAMVLGGSSHRPGEPDDTEAFHRDLERWAREVFDVESVDHRWSAQDYVTVDHVPYIGRCAYTRNAYVATGYRKWGMTGGTVAGMLLADILTGRHNPWAEVFDATRLGGAESVPTFVKENASVGMHLVKDRVARLRAGDLRGLAPGTGGVVRAGGRAVGAYRSPAGDVVAVSLTCTHLGCSVQWNNAEASWDCPCHGSRFTRTGEVIEGPATRPLERIEVEGEDGT